MAVTASRRSSSSSTSTAAISSAPGALERTRGGAQLRHLVRVRERGEVGQVLGGPRAPGRRRRGEQAAEAVQVRRGERGQRVDDPVGDGRGQRAAHRVQRGGVVGRDDDPAAVVHQGGDGGGDLGGLDVVQNHERVVADGRDDRAGLVRRVPRRRGELAGIDGREVRGEAAQARQRHPGQDGPPDLLVRPRRDPVRSRRAEPVDDDQKALVVAHARPDVQHPVTSACSAARATVTVRIAGVDTMLHPREACSTQRRREVTPCDLGLLDRYRVPTSDDGVAMRRDTVSTRGAPGGGRTAPGG